MQNTCLRSRIQVLNSIWPAQMYAVSIHRDGLALLSQIGGRAKAFHVLIPLARRPVHFTFPTLTSFTET